MTDLVFVDCETTGLDVNVDEVWEICLIRYNTASRSESTTVLQVQHSMDRIDRLPDSFQADHHLRYVPATAYTPAGAAAIVRAVLTGSDAATKPHLVGINPAFDAAFLSKLLQHNNTDAFWHYHLIDLSVMTLGWLTRHGRRPTLPWRSDDLAAVVGINSGEYARHTARGDAEMVRDWWLALEESAGGVHRVPDVMT